ncbi:DNA repair ATPase [Thermomonas brevis]|uniref:DNA repair ATPase n=1 Tax=Thermomonas brevis TaxID=215691 RepID=A0A7G9QUP0_9GAMM|nr:DNA repair ATPase [Thermomonas brevis]QNN47065.1 DNA repair ATPase [Thermomonas brevis]
MTDTSPQDTRIDQAVAEGGAYEVLRKRLLDQGQRLQGIAESLNGQRLQEFGDSKMEIAGRLRIRSEHNAVGRDIVQVGDLLLFGYNVFLGLKSTTVVADVFSLYKLVDTAEGYDVTPVDMAGSFLGDADFQRDFNELYSYYKDARLLQLLVKDSKLLAAFQVGQKSTDVRVFRWNIASSGEVGYIDTRGERDIVLPPPFDFEWTRATKDMEVSGRFPHLNILDTLFVETTGGDLTLKVENNTETGSGVYSEPVEDRTQSLDDARIEYAKVGSLILLKVLPYRETTWRGLVFNTQTRKATRLDAIVQACIQLPEDHGIIFPGGYYLQNGEHKAFDATVAGMQYKRTIRSPNGEDVLYVFYERDTGQSALLVYNMVQRRLQPPILAHGYARLKDGRMVLFHAENDDPTRVHQMQVWNTPFAFDEYAAARPPSTSFMGRIGNAELVRTVSDLFDLARDIGREEVSASRYQLLAQATRRLFDVHPWIDDAHTGGLTALLHGIAETGESVLDEFQKVLDIRRQSEAAMAKAQLEHRGLLGRLQPEAWSQAQDFVDALNAIAAQRGQLLTIRDYRYIDTAAIDAMSAALAQAHERVGVATGEFLASPKALAPFEQRLAALDEQAQKAATASQLALALKDMQAQSHDLDMLSALMASLKVDDATRRTAVVDALSGLYARLNQTKARADQRRKTLGSAEAVAQFGAQFALFGQSVTSALGIADTPEKADEQLARLMVQLEELESQFGEHEQFLGDILAKREELLEAFEAHKQALLDDRQRKAQALLDAANRILEGLGRRTQRFDSADELNAFFAGDALIQKLRELVERLRGLKDAVKADDIEARIKAARDQAVRALRDRSELFEDGGNVIKLGPRHRFSVNTQPLDLTLLPRGDHLALHLTGTDYMERVDDPALDALKPFWQVTLESESPELYRGEYLAGLMLDAAMQHRDGLTLPALQQLALDPDALAKAVRDFAAPRYRDGYEKGIHDFDAALLLRSLLALQRDAGPLVHAPDARALALAFWAVPEHAEAWATRIRAARAIDALHPIGEAIATVQAQLADALAAFAQASGDAFPEPQTAPRDAAAYLLDCMPDAEMKPQASAGADTLAHALRDALARDDAGKAFRAAQEHLRQQPGAEWRLVAQAMATLAGRPELAEHARYANEAASLYLHGARLHAQIRRTPLAATVIGLLGEHPRLQGGNLTLTIDDAFARFHRHLREFIPAYQRFQTQRAQAVQQARAAMRLEEFKPRPLTSFVRNRLINDIYLGVIGDNLAKQMGTVGEAKRSDLMGLLMLISPPGYGKTTLMEYVAHRLGLVFMKINGPALGHEVRSIDPAQAPDATSRQELEKLNLALEMGSNVMLYVDDIQHTHPEFLQKFISLCDGTRRIEGVWKGRTKTYDMRGRKFCVVMAGNPYTESGEVFKIPDMLANRADIYNLGDVLGGMEDAFKLSYIENSLTSNPVLAPLATREMADLYLLADKAAGKEVSTNALKHGYSGAEINEIVAVLQRLMAVREVVYRVNQQYIASAAQADKYRTEPPFKLQGSYRNMNKLAEKISPVMNPAELQQLISDHYLGESQLLTSGAEENLLKLAELRGVMGETEHERWKRIKADFLRNKAMGGDDADVGGRMVAQLADIATHLDALRGEAASGRDADAPWDALLDALRSLRPAETAQADAAPSGTLLSAAFDGIKERQAPMLEILRANLARQDILNQSLIDLFDRLGNAPAAPAPAPTPPRKQGDARTPRARTAREIAFDRELASLRFRDDLEAAGKPAPPQGGAEPAA